MKMELCYNGDYPGFQCIKINDTWATPEQEKMMLMLFEVDSLPKLFNKIVGPKIPGSEEHDRWVGLLKVEATKLP